MNAAFDHLVHFLHRVPEEATTTFRQAGFHAMPGGRHTHWGTWNSVSYFDLSYIEFLAVENREVASQSDNPLIQQLVEEHAAGEGMGQIAIRTTELEQWAKRLQESGLQVTGPLPGSRVREDGTRVAWRMLFAQDQSSERIPPFFIEWEQSDEERHQDLRERGIIAEHANGAKRLVEVGYAVRELGEAAGDWKRWFGWEAGPAFADEQLGATCRTIPLPGGNVVLCQPNGAGLTQQALEARGERPFYARFAGAKQSCALELYGGSYYIE
jgi:Glyoxalase-like domain